MKTTKLDKMNIKNFKGIETGLFHFGCKNTEIVADVMQGKSTIKDAYFWCLGMEVDNFYPVDKNNRFIEDLETNVELDIYVDGINYILSRSSKIKYKNKAFDGFKKDMFKFDGVPCTTTEYKTKICDLFGVADFEMIKYLSVLNYFNEQVNWKDRRALLYSLFVDKSSIEKLNSCEKYNLISNELLKGKSSTDIATMLNSENNRLVDSKRKNEILLADKKGELHNYANINYANIESELATVEKEIADEQNRIDNLDKNNIKNSIINKINKATIEKENLCNEDSAKKMVLNNKIEYLDIKLAQLKVEGERYEKQLKTLTEKYNELKVAKFDETKTICHVCHQPLKQADIDKLKADWEETNDTLLEKLKNEILSFKKLYLCVKEEYSDILTKAENFKQEFADLMASPKISELETEIETLRVELEKCDSEEIDTSILDKLKSKRNFLIVELGKKDSHDKLKDKIESLYAEQRELVNAEILLAKKRNQLEEYTLDIISLVNDSINSNFDGVKFKLFEELTATAQRNIKECCTITHNGIEYQSCSTGEKALVNLIIVSTLQKTLGTKLCLFADDASILNIPNPPDTQIVFLVNEKGKKLNCIKISEIY